MAFGIVIIFSEVSSLRNLGRGILVLSDMAVLSKAMAVMVARAVPASDTRLIELLTTRSFTLSTFHTINDMARTAASQLTQLTQLQKTGDDAQDSGEDEIFDDSDYDSDYDPNVFTVRNSIKLPEEVKFSMGELHGMSHTGQ
jgi:hypothetical protein